jgi:transcriptional regulator with XRE-family HTH domain
VTVEIDREDEADPNVSTLANFGQEVRLERERHKITQMALAKEAHCHYTLVQKIENAVRVPTLEFAHVCDRVFNTHGRFARIWPLVIKYAFPKWFRPYVKLEMQAAIIQAFELTVIPGLLQTPAYARAVLETGRHDDLEDLITGRLERQHVLTRTPPPRLWCILEEAILRRPYGGKAIMREQLARLLKEMDNPRTVVQIIPSTVPSHAAIGGAFYTLSFDDGSAPVVYIDGFPQGRLTAETHHVTEALRGYDLLKAVALSPDASADLVAATAKELYE